MPKPQQHQLASESNAQRPEPKYVEWTDAEIRGIRVSVNRTFRKELVNERRNGCGESPGPAVCEP